MSERQYILRGLTENGEERFYTGRAGEGWVSANPNHAFCYDTMEEARRKAMGFNRNSALHGLRFVAIPDPVVNDPMEDFNYRGSRYHY